MTMPSDVVTNPWLQPRIWVSAKTLLVSCCIKDLLGMSDDAGSVRRAWRAVKRLLVRQGAVHFLSRDWQTLDAHADRVGHRIGNGRYQRPDGVLANAPGVVWSLVARRHYNARGQRGISCMVRHQS